LSFTAHIRRLRQALARASLRAGPRLKARQRRTPLTTHPSRHWFQLSLKSLFGLTLLVATFFAGYSLATKQAEARLRAEREAREKAEADRFRLQLEVFRNSGDFSVNSYGGISAPNLKRSTP
jgi:hypothetical protein